MKIKLLIEEPKRPDGRYRILVYCGACDRFVRHITAAAVPDRLKASMASEESALPPEKRVAAVDAERQSAVADADELDLAQLVSSLEQHDCNDAVPPAH